MQKVTEDQLITAKQPQKVFTIYNFPLLVVVDMINETSTEMRQLEKSFLGTTQHQIIEKGALSSSHSFFAARRHLYNKKVYVMRIHYQFAKATNSKSKFSVVISHAEIVEEKNYQPILPL
jgi:hypothetical protein